MKKKIAVFLAASMALSMIPVSAFARTNNYVNKTVTVEKGHITSSSDGINLVIKDNNGDLAHEGSAEFVIELDGAEWTSALVSSMNADTHTDTGSGSIEVSHVSDTKAKVEIISASSESVSYTEALSYDEDETYYTDKDGTVFQGTFTDKDDFDNYVKEHDLYIKKIGAEKENSYDSEKVYYKDEALSQEITLADDFGTYSELYEMVSEDVYEKASSYDAGKEYFLKSGEEGAESYEKVDFSIKHYVEEKGAYVEKEGFEKASSYDSSADYYVSASDEADKKVFSSEDEFDYYVNAHTLYVKSVKTVSQPTYFYIPIYAKITEKGEAVISVDSKASVVSSGSYTFANAIAGSAKAKIKGDVPISDDGTEIKDIYIEETTGGSLEEGQRVTLKLSKNFKFESKGELKVIIGDIEISDYRIEDDREISFKISKASTKASDILISGIVIEPDDADTGDTAEITISGAGINKGSFEIGEYSDYGTEIYIYDEDEEMPVFYSGNVYDEEDDITLPITIEEIIPDSINVKRKITFTFPDGVMVVTAETGAEGEAETGVYVYEDSDDDANNNWQGSLGTSGNSSTAKVEIKKNVVTISGIEPDKESDEIIMTFAFNLAIAPDFTGDVDVTVSGSALDNEKTLTVAEVEKPFTVEAKTNNVNIDYRNVPVSDITITESYAGALAEEEYIVLKAENMNFEKGVTYEVTKGDLEIDKLTVDSSEGTITLKVKEESSKESTIVISDIELYLSRMLPSGGYDLLITDCRNGRYDYGEYDCTYFESCHAPRTDKDSYFDADDVTAVEDYIKVVTSGRDKDDSTLTTDIVVPIGEKTIYAGGKAIDIDVPAYLSQEGYTMLPVRAVAEALDAVVTWDKPTKTVSILYGSRIISMKVNSKIITVNGTLIAAEKAVEIKDNRAFLSMRFLGYALGMTEADMRYDKDLKIAYFN